MSASIPEDLSRVAALISDWRAAHPRRSQSLPPAVWQAIAPLRDSYPDVRLVRALHVSAHSLRKHCGGPSHHQPHPPAAGPAPRFVPVSTAPSAPSLAVPGSTSLRLVLERADGTRLSVHLPTTDGTDIAALAASLLRL